MSRRAVLSTLALGSLSGRALAALPPAFGGELRLPAPGPLALPHPSRRRSPFEAYVSRAVYAPLSELGGAEVDGDQLT
ncbi:MAG: ABC transporter substrate-binding protein, partial [Myxococcota bacterium]